MSQVGPLNVYYVLWCLRARVEWWFTRGVPGPGWVHIKEIARAQPSTAKNMMRLQVTVERHNSDAFWMSSGNSILSFGSNSFIHSFIQWSCGKVMFFTGVCLFTGGSPSDHYPWWIGQHRYLLPASDTWRPSLETQVPTPLRERWGGVPPPPGKVPPVTYGGHHWRHRYLPPLPVTSGDHWSPVKTCSFGDPHPRATSGGGHWNVQFPSILLECFLVRCKFDKKIKGYKQFAERVFKFWAHLQKLQLSPCVF